MNIADMRISARSRIERPNIVELKKKNFMLIDMHVHTRFSDSFTRIRKIISKCERLGIGIAITDHNEIEGVLRAFNLNSSVKIIPGIEISTKEGPHILLHFYNLDELKHFYEKNIAGVKRKISFERIDLTIYELLRITKTYNCLVSFAHPCGPGYFNYEKNVCQGNLTQNLIQAIESIEVINGVNSRRMNLMATELAEKNKKNIIGGSDAHTLSQVGTVLTCSNADSIKEFLDNIKNNKNLVIGKELSKVRYIPYLAKCIPKHAVHPICKYNSYHHGYLKQKIKNHSPKIIEKLTEIKSKSIRALKDPIIAVRKINAKTYHLKAKIKDITNQSKD